MSIGESRFSDRPEWFSLWSADKESILATMVRNLYSDIEAGYKPSGDSVGRQIADIADYRNNFNVQSLRLLNMPFAERNRWCFDDMKSRGVIA